MLHYCLILKKIAKKSAAASGMLSIQTHVEGLLEGGGLVLGGRAV